MKEKQLLKSSPHIQFGPETQVAHSKPTFYECCITYTGLEWATCWTKLDVGGGGNCLLGGERTGKRKEKAEMRTKRFQVGGTLCSGGARKHVQRETVEISTTSNWTISFGAS